MQPEIHHSNNNDAKETESPQATRSLSPPSRLVMQSFLRNLRLGGALLVPGAALPRGSSKALAANGRQRLTQGDENLSATVSKGSKAITKLIKGGLFLLALSAASSLQQLSYAQIAEAPGSSIFTVVRTPNIRPFPFHSDLAAVSASSGSDIWAIGQSGVHFAGLTWTAFALPDIAGDLTSGITGVADL